MTSYLKAELEYLLTDLMTGKVSPHEIQRRVPMELYQSGIAEAERLAKAFENALEIIICCEIEDNWTRMIEKTLRELVAKV